MRFLIIQENGRHEKNRAFRECFSFQRALQYHGQIADVWGLGHENYEEGYFPDFNNYDTVINLENYDETGWVPSLRHISQKKILWAIDAHVKGMDGYMKTANEGQYDVFLQATPEFLHRDHIWFPNAYDDVLVQPRTLTIKKEYDIGFCGNINNRGPLLDILDKHFKLKRDIFVIGHSMVAAINSYKVGFNANISIDINYRNFETIGCGTCLLTSANAHYGTLGFEDGVNCLIYRSIDEMVEKARDAINNDEKRIAIQRAGHILSQRHTYKHRADLLLRILGQK